MIFFKKLIKHASAFFELIFKSNCVFYIFFTAEIISSTPLMVIFVTKTSCPRREMTALALTVCAHIAATLYTPRFCAFEHRFLPFPNLTSNPPSALPHASLVVEVLEGGMGMAPGGMP